MAEASLKIGGSWATKEDLLLGFNDENGNYKPIPFDFSRASIGTRVNRDGLIEEVQDNIPRIDFSNDGSLLLEPQRTNLFLYSESLESSWTASGTNPPTLTASQFISPDGTQNASRLQFPSTNTISILSQLFSHTSGQQYTISIYAKSNIGSNQSFKLFGDYGAPSAISGVFVATNEWQRFEFTYTATATGSRGGGVYYLPNTTSDLQIYGIQVEAGSYPTSYIPTSGSAVTRNVDLCEKTGFQGVSMNATQGTILMHIDNPYALGGNNDFHMFRATGSSGINDGWLFRCNSGTTIDLLERVGGSTGAQVSSLASKDQINKIAWSFNASTFLISTNGVTKSYTGTYNGTQIDIDEFNTSGSNLQGLEIINMQFFETALTQDELNALTTL